MKSQLNVTVDRDLDREMRKEASAMGMTYSAYVEMRLREGGPGIRRMKQNGEIRGITAVTIVFLVLIVWL